MQLTTTDKTALSALNPVQKGLVEARLSTPFRSLPKQRQMEICLNMVTFLHSKTGDKGGTDPKILQFQANEFLGELKGLNGELTESEIFMACEGLYRGEWGQFFGLNAKSYNQLLTGFRTKEERGRAWLTYLSHVQQPEKEDRTSEPNPEGQKRVLEILKQFVKKPDYSEQAVKLKPKPPVVKSERDKFIQQCFRDFFELHKKGAIPDGSGNDSRFIMFEGKEVDEAEYTQIRLTEYDQSKND